MNFKTEAQFTKNASKRVFEEVYTNEDMIENKLSYGNYRLDVPQMFASNPSQEKAISIRRAICEPNKHRFTMRASYIDIQGMPIDSNIKTFTVRSNDDINTTLHNICDLLKKEQKDETGTVTESYRIVFDYNKSTGELTLAAQEEESGTFPVPFRFEFQAYKDCSEFWNLLNQTGKPFDIGCDPEDFDYDAIEYTQIALTFSNVWSRRPLFVHASFSNSKKHYLCRTGDFWFKPSKYYYDNINQNNFEIFFTTDGTNRIIPYDAVKIIELCFILKQFARI